MRYKWCRQFGHKWVYSCYSGLNGRVELRACRRCGCIEEYRRNVPAYGNGWFMLTMRTKLGAESLLKKLEEWK